VGHSSNDLEFFIDDPTFRVSFSALRKLINTFPIFPYDSGRWVLTSGLAWGLAPAESGPDHKYAGILKTWEITCW